MFIHYRTLGFIFKKENRGEADQLFSIFTKDFGRLEILGKAIRKIKSKLRSGAGILYLSEIEFIQGKTHKTLTDAILINKFQNIRNDLKKLNTAYRISEDLDKLIRKQEPDQNIWQLLNETFNKLNNQESEIKSQTGHSLKIIYYYFLWNLFSLLGYQPQLYNCTLCQKEITPPLIYFSSREGGVICSDCFENLPAGGKEAEKISPEVVKILRLILNKDWKILSRLKIKNTYLACLKNISEDYLSSLLEEEK